LDAKSSVKILSQHKDKYKKWPFLIMWQLISKFIMDLRISWSISSSNGALNSYLLI
jgi:hypothetical protein